ncbi:hypothetical protein, partial [Kosmotoga pacifica]
AQGSFAKRESHLTLPLSLWVITENRDSRVIEFSVDSFWFLDFLYSKPYTPDPIPVLLSSSINE